MGKRFLPLLAAAVLVAAIPLATLARPLTPETFVVEPAYFRHWVFTTSRSARVFGQFRAQGGGSNDIRVYLVDQKGFADFRSGQAISSYYASGQVSSAQVDVRLGTGQYIVIFDNTFSPFSSKNITSNLQVEED